MFSINLRTYLVFLTPNKWVSRAKWGEVRSSVLGGGLNQICSNLKQFSKTTEEPLSQIVKRLIRTPLSSKLSAFCVFDLFVTSWSEHIDVFYFVYFIGVRS